MGRLAVFTEDPGWHGKRLREAFARRGHETRFVSLTACRLNLDEEGPLVVIPGFEPGLPDAAFVRGVPGGTLEQVVLYLDILHALTALGIPVYNEGRAVERTVDKGMTSFLLHQAGIPTPPAWVTSDAGTALAIAQRELRQGHGIVTKPLFGSQGDGLRRYDTLGDLAGFSDDAGVYYLQRFVYTGDASHDFRVFVVAGKTVAAMRRSGVTWLNNVHQGAVCEPVRLDDARLCRLAEDAVRQLNMNYAGVDVIRDEQGRYSILEVNSIPAWKGLQGVAEISIADLLVDDFLSRIRAARTCTLQAI